MKTSITYLFIGLALLMMASCGNDGSGNDKANTDSSKKVKESTAFDTASFLKSHNMTVATYSDIPANTSMTVPGTSVYFPILNMGAGSKLIIPETYDSCFIIIGKGSFDQNTEIIADGTDGVNGHKLPDPWDNGWWQSGVGDKGAKGVSGTNGSSGTNAVKKIRIQIGLIKLLTLSIHSNGGKGGNGGDAGKGQLGGNKKGPFGHNGDGGDGGDAGNGGNGGNAGNIVVEVWAGGGSIDLPNAMQYLSAIGSKGIAGKGGKAGLANEGGNHTTPGVNGRSGSNGTDGKAGTTKITVITKPALP